MEELRLVSSISPCRQKKKKISTNKGRKYLETYVSIFSKVVGDADIAPLGVSH